jgi:hypothetical protein
MENLSEHPRSPGGPGVVDWTPPRTREEVDQAIITLSNDIGLILAQLAEEQAAWCQRTGRAPIDYGAWRRRALFAKVHKEGQLRECKRIRAQLTGAAGEALSQTHADLVAGLVPLCRHVIEAWIEQGGTPVGTQLDGALSDLAEFVDRLPAARSNGIGVEMAVRGRPERPVLLGPPLASGAD